MDSVYSALQLTVLLLLAGGVAWLMIEIVLRDPRGALLILRDVEAFARTAAPELVATPAVAPAHLPSLVAVMATGDNSAHTRDTVIRSLAA